MKKQTPLLNELKPWIEDACGEEKAVAILEKAQKYYYVSFQISNYGGSKISACRCDKFQFVG